eukprot:4666395-Pyramimonas_sp.AAC.1
MAPMRGSYPKLHRRGEAVPPMPTDLSRRRPGPLHLPLHVFTFRSITNAFRALSSHEGSAHLCRRASTHWSEILSNASF